ncbi:MAG: cytochrome P450, partial [Cyanobacteria bacterium REEB65]|nr:cytochrome P450 [Cyanobacteria bacterium REEB65]
MAPLGTLLAFRKDPVGFLLELADQQGDVAPFRLARLDACLLKSPEAIKDVLVTHARKFKKSRGLEIAKEFLGEGLL